MKKHNLVDPDDWDTEKTMNNPKTKKLEMKTKSTNNQIYLYN